VLRERLHDAINTSLTLANSTVVDMLPGDVLHIPRGVVHHTEALGGSGSVHITFGVDSGGASWMAILRALLNRHVPDQQLLLLLNQVLINASLADAAGLRESLPVGWIHQEVQLRHDASAQASFEQAKSSLSRSVHEAARSLGPAEQAKMLAAVRRVQKAEFGDTLALVAGEFMKEQAAMPWGTLGHDRVTSASQVCAGVRPVVRRSSVALDKSEQCSSGSFALHSQLRELTLGAHARQAAELCLGLKGCMPVSSLPGLRPEEQISLATQLIAMGILQVP